MKRETIIMKFGGTSLGNPKKILRVAKHIQKYRHLGQRVIVIVSAMGDETDRLLELAEQICLSPDPRERDVLLHTGEIVSASLLAIALNEIGVKARSYNASQAQIVGTGTYGQARVKGFSNRKSLLADSQKQVLVLTGFQTILEGGDEIATLGRGGSDASAVAIAAALGADICNIYTDVDGVYAVDPRLVPGAKRFSGITFSQMIYLASAGAGVLMDRSVIIAQAHNIKVRVLLSPSFGPSTGGTIVSSLGNIDNIESGFSQVGLAIRKDLSVAKFSHLANSPGQAAKIFRNISCNILEATQGLAGRKAIMSILVEDRYVGEIAKFGSRIGSGRLEIGRNLAAITLVDPMMKEQPGYFHRITRILAMAKINIEMLTSAQISIMVAVKQDSLKKAVLALAKEFRLTQ